MADRIPSGHHEVYECLIDYHGTGVSREVGFGE
jgi:hypothetical protein